MTRKIGPVSPVTVHPACSVRRALPLHLVALLCALLAVALGPARAASAAQNAAAQNEPDAADLLKEAIFHWMDLIEPPDGIPAGGASALSAHVTFAKSDGLPGEFAGATADLAYEAPDRLTVRAHVGDQTYAVGRDGQNLWAHEPGKKFAVLGKPGVLRFKADPTSIDDSVLPPFELPVSKLKLRVLIPLFVHAELLPSEKIDGVDCYVLRVTLRQRAIDLTHAHAGQGMLWLRKADHLPARVTYSDGRKLDVQVDVTDPKVSAPLPAERWRLAPNPGDDVETVAVSHLVNFLHVAPRILNNKVPTLGPATGEREKLGKCGRGRLDLIDGTRVLTLRGTPEEMGRQHGTLLREEARDVAERLLFGIGVGSSFEKGKWFFGEIEGAQARLLPFMDPRHLREMDALSKAAGMSQQEGRLANFFPELFHCSGFALEGKAVADGHLYHGRVLDYMRGIGLEQNAVVIVHQPDQGNAWVNVGYAGFIGSVTAMNEKGIAIGEMGGRGYGNWDGRPMAQLMREVMEKASTLDEAVAIMRDGPRTCEYYYVISDGNSKLAVGIAATPDKFDVVRPGQSDPRLPHAVEDAVLLSAGDRYETLVKRVRENYGKFDADSARALMTRPVCMTSNIQSVLFRPDTLDFWVANADSRNVASATRYTHYNLRELLGQKSESGEKVSKAQGRPAAAHEVGF